MMTFATFVSQCRHQAVAVCGAALVLTGCGGNFDEPQAQQSLAAVETSQTVEAAQVQPAPAPEQDAVVPSEEATSSPDAPAPVGPNIDQGTVPAPDAEAINTEAAAGAPGSAVGPVPVG